MNWFCAVLLLALLLPVTHKKEHEQNIEQPSLSLYVLTIDLTKEYLQDGRTADLNNTPRDHPNWLYHDTTVFVHRLSAPRCMIV